MCTRTHPQIAIYGKAWHLVCGAGYYRQRKVGGETSGFPFAVVCRYKSSWFGKRYHEVCVHSTALGILGRRQWTVDWKVVSSDPSTTQVANGFQRLSCVKVALDKGVQKRTNVYLNRLIDTPPRYHKCPTRGSGAYGRMCNLVCKKNLRRTVCKCNVPTTGFSHVLPLTFLKTFNDPELVLNESEG